MSNDRQLLNELKRRELEELRSIDTKTPMTTPDFTPTTNLGFGGSLLEGFTFGLAPKISAGLGAAVAYPFVDNTMSELYKQGFESMRRGATQYEQESPVLSAVGKILGGLGSSGALAATAPVKAVGAIAGRGGVLGRMGAGALAGESAQRIYEAGLSPIGKEQEILTSPTPSIGGIVGGLLPAVGAAATGIKTAINPAISESKRRIVDLAKKYDVPLGLDDLTDSQFYQYMISEGRNLPFAGKASSIENQLKGFTKAIARSVGLEGVDNLTPVNMDKAFTRVGKKFDNLTKGKTFSMNDDALDSLSAIEEGVASGTYGASGVTAFKNHTKEIFNALENDSLSGDRLSSLRNKFARISRTGTNPEAKSLAKDMENVLIDMIGEGAPEALKNAKYQYKNLITIEPLARKSQVEGFISPAQLTNRVAQVYKRDFTRGKAGQLGDLAELGQAIKQKVPQSGTAPRQMAQNLGVTDLAAVGSGFVNPALPMAYFTGKLGKLAANRALQARNVNPLIIEKAMNPVINNTGQPILSGLRTGAVLGSLNQ